MSARLLSDAPECFEKLESGETLARPRCERRLAYDVAAFLEPSFKDLASFGLYRSEVANPSALRENPREATIVVLLAVQIEQFGDPKSRTQKNRDCGVVLMS